ncbi:hypothetical protein [Leptospira sp. GIMC2001]|uniref:hypothetical protein n=1 Tax=Leptospira sp. GIMC2001 TaxID=1513297 RepID=UPI00234BCBE7|nr:hypothetical protein [Leptospira sp. GIMC2001]WCL48702.1 hypothetical protein O4O04_15530 [Leptospira sp. GIMC2001]
MSSNLLNDSCLYCGTNINHFLSTGKFGCANCYVVFWNHPLATKDLESKKNWCLSQEAIQSFDLHNPFRSTIHALDKELFSNIRGEGLHFSARYRVARNLEKSFFLPNRSFIDHARNLLLSNFPNLKHIETNEGSGDNTEIWSLSEHFVQIDPNIINLENTKILIKYQFRLGDEDQIRFELILSGEIRKNEVAIKFLQSLEKTIENDQIYKEIMAFMQKRSIFIFRKNWGFLTSCPTNVGRGDRFSLIFSREKVALSEPGQLRDWIKRGFGIEIASYSSGLGGKFYYFSIKNFNRRRKYYFLHSIVSLVF